MQDNNATFTCEDFTTFSSVKWNLEDINISDERLEIETVATSTTGIALSVSSSLVSTCSSILVIYIIMRSAKGLKGSVYHRILFGMSVFDILQSLAISFVTLPMPKDMIYRQYQGHVIGNNLTCQIQGFAVAMGSITGIMYNLMLSIYYLFSIRYNMPDDVFSKRLEPCLHTVSVLVGIATAFMLLRDTGMNPNPTHSNWCAANAYPYYCSSFVDENADKQKLKEYGGIFNGCLLLGVLVLCMVLIVLKVRKQGKDAANDNENDDNLNTSDGEEHPSSALRTRSRQSAYNSLQTRTPEQLLHNTGIITRQAWAYTIINLFNYFMIFALPIAREILNNPIPPTWFQAMVLVLRPLQGLFNCMIFIYHKVEILQRGNNPCLDTWSALKKVLKGDEGQARIIVNLMLVRHHTALSQVRFADDVNLEEYVDGEDDEEEDEKDEEIVTSHSRFDLTASSPRRCLQEANDDEGNEQANDDHCGEQFSRTSVIAMANNAHVNSSANGQDKEMAQTDRNNKDKEQRRYYQYRIKSSSGKLAIADEQESIQDLSGFQSSSQPLSAMSDSLTSSFELRHSDDSVISLGI